MTLPEGRKPLTEEDIKRLIESCVKPMPELTDEMKVAIQMHKEKVRNRENEK